MVHYIRQHVIWEAKRSCCNPRPYCNNCFGNNLYHLLMIEMFKKIDKSLVIVRCGDLKVLVSKNLQNPYICGRGGYNSSGDGTYHVDHLVQLRLS